MLHLSPVSFSVELGSLLRGSRGTCRIQQREERQTCISSTIFLACPDNFVLIFAHSAAFFSTLVCTIKYLQGFVSKQTQGPLQDCSTKPESALPLHKA